MEELRSEDPQWIGEYRLLGRLGEGGMGRVYLARSERGRTVAVKLVQAELASRADFRRRFAHEVAAAQRVGGKWTAPVLDADTEAETPWVATGYIGGPSLAAVVSEDFGPLPEHSVRVLADGLAHALEDIHAAGLVHRDLKPANVLVTIDGPRVIDFGIARTMETLAGSGLTMTGAVIGSPGFMSPEQVRGERVTPASDIFCLGSVLAFAATGRQPFGTADSGMHALMFRIAEEEPDMTGLPDSLHPLIAGCLVKDPARRPGLAQVLELAGGGATGTEPWLPGGLLARLGRDALQLLETESPRTTSTSHPLAAHSAQSAPSAPATPPPGPDPRLGPVSTPPPAMPGPSTPPHFGPTGPMPYQQPYAQPAPGPMTGPLSGPMNGPANAGPLTGPVPSAPYRAPTFRPPAHWRSPRGLATAVCLLLTASVIFAVIDMMLNFALYDAYERATISYDGEVEEGKRTLNSLGVIDGLVTLATIVVWLVWLRRARVNAEVFAPDGHRFSRGWTVGAWFTPIVQFWFPKQVVDDIWAASRQPGRPLVLSRGILNWWWALFCGMWIFGMLSGIVSGDAETYDGQAVGVAMTIWADMVTIPAGVLAILVAHRLTNAQEQCAGQQGLAAGAYPGPGYR